MARYLMNNKVVIQRTYPNTNKRLFIHFDLFICWVYPRTSSGFLTSIETIRASLQERFLLPQNGWGQFVSILAGLPLPLQERVVGRWGILFKVVEQKKVRWQQFVRFVDPEV